MKIVEVTEKEIYCYGDCTFYCFDIASLTLGGKIIGVSWAAGKAPDPMTGKPEFIHVNSLYHNVLMQALIDSYKK